MSLQMMDRCDFLLGISDVADLTGVMKETLRVWERRYGFPNPSRSSSGKRLYSEELVGRLRLIKNLLDLGYRPSRVVPVGGDELISLSNKARAPVSPIAQASEELLQPCLILIKERRVAKLRSLLQGYLLRDGLRKFVINIAAPLTHLVRTGWMANKFSVLETYVMTTVLEPLVKDAIQVAAIEAAGSDGPKVLLASAPQERSLSELLFVQALFTLEGADCELFGCITNVNDISARAAHDDVDLVAMCCSPSTSPRAVIENTRRLQGKLGAKFLVAPGYRCPASIRRRIADDCMLDLDSVGEQVLKWRTRLIASQHPT